MSCLPSTPQRGQTRNPSLSFSLFSVWPLNLPLQAFPADLSSLHCDVEDPPPEVDTVLCFALSPTQIPFLVRAVTLIPCAKALMGAPDRWCNIADVYRGSSIQIVADLPDKIAPDSLIQGEVGDWYSQ